MMALSYCTVLYWLHVTRHKTTHTLEANDALGIVLVGTHFTSPSLVLTIDFL